MILDERNGRGDSGLARGRERAVFVALHHERAMKAQHSMLISAGKIISGKLWRQCEIDIPADELVSDIIVPLQVLLLFQSVQITYLF